MKAANYPGPLTAAASSAASASAVAVNLLRFKLFGVLPGAVVLAGPVTPLESGASSSSSSSTQNPARNRVRASFDSPRISIGGPMVNLPVLRLGPTSVVHLDTTYLGPRLRISRGATSGTPFVFKHLSEPGATAETSSALDAAVAKSWAEAEVWRPLVRSNADLSGKHVGVAFMAFGFATWVAAAVMSMVRGTGPLPDPVLSVSTYGLAAIGAALATSTGGIDERKRQ